MLLMMQPVIGQVLFFLTEKVFNAEFKKNSITVKTNSKHNNLRMHACLSQNQAVGLMPILR